MREKRGKPTKEEIQSSDELKRFKAALDALGIHPKDANHPLSEFPPNRLRAAMRNVTSSDNDEWFKSFAVFAFEDYCGGISERTVRGWLADSRKITDIQLARVCDIATTEAIAGPSRFAQEVTESHRENIANMDVSAAYNRLYNALIESLFFADKLTRMRVKRLAIISDVLRLDETKLDAVTTIVSAVLAGGMCRSLSENRTLSSIESASEFVDEIAENSHFSTGCEDLAKWADEWPWSIMF